MSCSKPAPPTELTEVRNALADLEARLDGNILNTKRSEIKESAIQLNAAINLSRDRMNADVQRALGSAADSAIRFCEKETGSFEEIVDERDEIAASVKKARREIDAYIVENR
jgi:hypothetical protein